MAANNPTEPLVVERTFDASVALVWDALTKTEAIRKWSFDSIDEFKPVVGFEFRFVAKKDDMVYDHRCKITEVIQDKKLAYTWRYEGHEGNTLVTIELFPKGGKTRLKLTHAGLETLPKTDGFKRENFMQGWTQIIGVDLKEYVEAAKGAGRHAVTIVREFDAPAEMVFDAWLDPKALGKWLFATPGGQMQRVSVDPRVGGQFEVTEKRGDMEVEHLGTYIEISRPRRLVFDFKVPKYSNESTRVSVGIAPKGDGCELTLTHERVLVEYGERVVHGWTMILNGLLATLGGDRAMVISRVLDAPRELVWDAMTDPKQVVKWWGPRGFSTTIEQMDVRPGGVWKHVMRGPDGANYPNKSIFREVVKPERIVFTHGGAKEGGGTNAHFVATWSFDWLGENKTKVTICMIFPTAELRNRIAEEYGALEGGKQTLERLAEMLARP